MTNFALGLLALASSQDPSDRVWDRLHFYAEGAMLGEATLENVDAAGNEADDRYRGRFRMRFGARYELIDEIDLHGRLSTASDGNDANNPYWDFGDGDGFNGSEAVVDRFYLDWKANEELHVLGGKQPHAFAVPPVYGEFIWDQDVSPAGVAVTWTPETREPSFDARGAAYVATEVADDEDPKMLGAQGNLYLPVDETAVQISSALYDWKDNGDTAVAGNQGNTATTEDFLIWESFAAITLPGGPLDEITGFLEFMNNLQESDEDTGWVLGGQLGPGTPVQGAFNLFLVLYQLDADAVFSPVAQDDTPIPGTGIGDGMEGAVLGGTYFWRENVAVKLWALTSDADGAEDDPLRLRFELDFTL
jgi:putative porin